MLLFDFLLEKSDPFWLVVEYDLIFAVDFGFVIFFATIYTLV